MAEVKNILVKLDISHSSAVARIWMPHAYTPKVQAILEQFAMHWPASRFEAVLPSTTTLGQLKSFLERDLDLPVGILHCFTSFRTVQFSEFVDVLPDRMPLAATVALMHREDVELVGENVAFLTCATTAGWLIRIDRSSLPHRGMDMDNEIISSLKNWRHCAGALAYFRSRLSKTDSTDIHTAPDLRANIDKYEKSEEESYDLTVKLIRDWCFLTGSELPNQLNDQQSQDWCMVTESSSEIQLNSVQARVDLESLHDTWRLEKLNRLKSCMPDLPSGSTFQRILLARNACGPGGVAATKPAPTAIPSSRGTIPQQSRSFRITSGMLLWGQMATVLEGSIDHRFQNRIENGQETVRNGTIKQHNIKFRCAARNGKWNVSRAFSHIKPSFDILSTDGMPYYRFGWVVHHEDYDPVEILRRCSCITKDGGISNSNQHVDKNVLYVNRYDWGTHHQIDQSVKQQCERYYNENVAAHLDPVAKADPDGNERLCRPQLPTDGHCIAIDAESWNPQQMLRLMREHFQHPPRPLSSLRVYQKRDQILTSGYGAEQRDTGALMSDHSLDYEFAWLLFSGGKSEMYPEQDELVGIVYDTSYDALAGMDYAVDLPV